MYRKIKSYVLRAGRMTIRQQQGLDKHLSNYALPLADEKWDLNNLFAKRAPVVVEIGFGMGHSLLQMAKDNPDINYIGIEVHLAGLGSFAADVYENKLDNVKIVNADAVEILQKYVPDNSLLGVQIFFPDPWPKKKHHKRRLIQKDFVNLLVAKIKLGGFVHCATDWEDYAHHMLEILTETEELSNMDVNSQYVDRPSSRPLTKFEQRGMRLGHKVWDLQFKKVNFSDKLA